MDLIEQQTRGTEAQMLLDNRILTEALDAIEKEVFDQWMTCPARDKDGKEALWQLAKTAQKFRGILTGYIETGKLATEQMKHFEERKGIRRLFGT
ncbi:MAG: hypothetical protein MUF33_05845 [Candidatus Nanopelagicales bacterium]|jgi:hypothetical protein|nr:hypothetical protein [Candidatus Nanopelagicales bacterium]